MSAIDKIIYKITQAIPAGLLFLTLLPPVLYKLGATGVAKVIYVMLGFLCHQRADRSFYLFGESLTYSKEEMISAVGFDKVFTINFSERFVCNEHFGCKFGVCSRCTGIYCGLLGGMIISEIFKGKEMPK